MFNALGLQASQGLQITTSFYWDRDDETRAWAQRFIGGEQRPRAEHDPRRRLQQRPPLSRAIKAAWTDDPKIVAAKMHEMPVNDMYNKEVKIRPDGRVLHDMFLVQVKARVSPTTRMIFNKILRTIPGREAFGPTPKASALWSRSRRSDDEAYQFLVGGERVQGSAGSFDSVNPATGTVTTR